MEAAVTVLAVKWQGNIAPQIMLNGMRKFFTLPEVSEQLNTSMSQIRAIARRVDI